MSKHFWVEGFLPNGRRFFSSSSKSKFSEGKMLAEEIAKGIAQGFIKVAPQQGNIQESGATRLTVELMVREWDGLSTADRVKDEGFAWKSQFADQSADDEADDLA